MRGSVTSTDRLDPLHDPRRADYAPARPTSGRGKKRRVRWRPTSSASSTRRDATSSCSEVRRADRRRGDHVHLLPVPLRHRPDHGQGRPGQALGDDRARRASSSSTARPRTSSPTATATTSATAPRPRSSSGIPEPETFQPLPWDRRSRASGARCFRNREEREDPGAFLTSDCRGNLKRIQARVRGRDGSPPPRRHRARDDVAQAEEDGTPSVEGVTKPYCYHIDQFSELQPIIHKVIEYGQAMGLDMIQGDHEDAPGQIELNFNFDRAEQTADNLSTYRQICKQVGRELGRVPVLHAEAVHGRLGERLPPQHLALEGRRERVHARHRRRPEAEPDRPLRDRRHPRAPRRAHRGHGLDRQLVPAPLGHGLLGAGVRRLGLPEPHDRAARLGARPLRVPLGRLGRQPVPLDGGADRGDVGRHRAQARSGRARGAQHLRGDGGGQGGQADPDDLRRRARRARGRRGREDGAAGRDVPCLHALQARRVGALLRHRHRLGRARSTSTSSRRRRGLPRPQPTA